MQAPQPFLIDGQWISSSQFEKIYDRHDNCFIRSICLADAKHVEQAVASCAAAFAKTRILSSLERSSLLQRVGLGIEKRGSEFIALLIKEAGKPRDLAQAEVLRAQQTFQFAAQEAVRPSGEILAMDASPAGKNHAGFVRRFPIGVILGITPFNFPLNLVAHKVAPALAAGNAILIKPALKTPLISLLLGEVLVEAGCLPGQVNIVPFHHDLIELLFSDRRIKMVSFTGSAEVGWQIKAKAIKQKVCLELGGNAALIIHNDSAWPGKVPFIASGAFGYAGQSCISIQRILIQEAIYEDFRRQFVEYVANKVVVGHPDKTGVLVGPMIDLHAQQKILSWVAQAVTAGARSLLPIQAEGNYLHPIILENVASDQSISCEEAFAPVVILEKYGVFTEAVERVNASRYGLQAGVLTNDLALADFAYENLEVGGVLINQVPTFRVENMPYGGIKDSGFGREGVRYAMEEMSEMKMLITQHN